VSYEPVVAIAGVTGAVGAEFIATMDRRAFPVRKLKALASARSAGKTIDFRGERILIEELTEKSFEGVDIALFSAGAGISRKFSPAAVKAGAVVIDNSSAFRMDPNVPLVIPEINANRIREHKGIIAVPNCSAITALVPLWPIHRQNRIKRVILSTYQAASGAGAAAMEELVESTRAYLDGRPFTPDPSKSPQWNRGAYLVNGPSHCAECHSPRDTLGGLVKAQRFAGGPNPEGEGWNPNITQKALAKWSPKDFENLLETGELPKGDTVGAGMREVVRNTAQLSPEDRAAMAAYLKSLPPVEGPQPPKRAPSG